MNIFERENPKLFVQAILSLSDEKECMAFLEDIMTTKEILDISQRMAVAKMLADKEVYSRISEETGASSATISRVNRCFLYGAGGYTSVLEKICEK